MSMEKFLQIFLFVITHFIKVKDQKIRMISILQVFVLLLILVSFAMGLQIVTSMVTVAGSQRGVQASSQAS